MGKLYVTLTIDTENSQYLVSTGKYRQDTMLGVTGPQDYGVRYVLERLKEYGVSATWYVSVFEKYLWGEKTIADICSLLLDNGHDIQLHTHPVWFMDAKEMKKVFMHQYSLEEQVHIISRGMEDLYKASGIRAIAHRAGGYGANRDTLAALKICGLKVDSSLYYSNEQCRLESGIKNAVHRIKGITEFPVSVYGRKLPPGTLRRSKTAYMKPDINACAPGDIIKACRSLTAMEGSLYLNIFMHSNSFYIFSTDKAARNLLGLNRKSLITFDKVMAFLVSSSDIEIITVKELYVRLRELELKKSDYLPMV